MFDSIANDINRINKILLWPIIISFLLYTIWFFLSTFQDPSIRNTFPSVNILPFLLKIYLSLLIPGGLIIYCVSKILGGRIRSWKTGIMVLIFPPFFLSAINLSFSSYATTALTISLVILCVLIIERIVLFYTDKDKAVYGPALIHNAVLISEFTHFGMSPRFAQLYLEDTEDPSFLLNEINDHAKCSLNR